jgi:hypothetical protein
MPRLDGTGPCGNGPKSGCGRGNCQTPEESGNFGCGRGRGRGLGLGCGRGRGQNEGLGCNRGLGVGCRRNSLTLDNSLALSCKTELLKKRIQDLEAELSLTKEILAEVE